MRAAVAACLLSVLGFAAQAQAPVMAPEAAPETAPETALRPVARPLPQAPMRPVLRPAGIEALGLLARMVAQHGTPLQMAEMPPLPQDRGTALTLDTLAFDALAATAVAPAPAAPVVALPELAVPGQMSVAPTNLAPITLAPTTLASTSLTPAPLDPASVIPTLEARMSAMNMPPLGDRLLHMEEMMDRMVAAQPAVLRLPPTAAWNGPQPVVRGALQPALRPLLRPAMLGSLAPRLAPDSPPVRSGEFELRIAARNAPMVYTRQMPEYLWPAISPHAIAEALRPALRPEDFEVVAAAAPVVEQPRGQAAPLAMGSGLCGVGILSGNVLGNVPGSGQCGVENAVEVTGVGGIRLSSGVTMDCGTATALATWVRDVANPAVGNTGGGLARLDVGGGYACRGRNNQPGARLSEHAYGRAIDIMGFTLRDGTRLTVLNNWGNSILRQMHRGACGIFGTVLGPEANRYHRDHFHFDTARYRSGSFCQ